VAALSLGRRFIGVDIDEVAVETTLARLGEVAESLGYNNHTGGPALNSDHPNIPKSCRIRRFEGAGAASPHCCPGYKAVIESCLLCEGNAWNRGEPLGVV